MIDTHIHAVSPLLPGMKPMPQDVAMLFQGPLQGMAERLKAEMAAGEDRVRLRNGIARGHHSRSPGDCAHPRVVQVRCPD